MLPEKIRLALNLAQALRATGPQLGRSLLGDRESWDVDRYPHTELQLMQPAQWLQATESLAHMLVPAVPRRLPAWVRLRPAFKPGVRLFLRPSKVYRYRPAKPRPDPSPDQAWFFINGICTDRHMLMLNAAYLSELFQRPLTLLHNSTCSVVPDLLECAFGKGWNGVTEAARLAFAPIYVALKQPQCKRVVLLAHSQGTIIAGVLLWLLRGLYPPSSEILLDGEPRCPEQRVARQLAHKWGFPCAETAAERAASTGAVKPPLTREELGKLEIYNFANCASLMGPIDTQARLPYLESYGNEHDLVARLGVLAPAKGLGAVGIGGERYVRRKTWGHLLNAHYLHPMEQEWRSLRKGQTPASTLLPLPGNRGRRPRLFDYLGGASPPAYADLAPPRPAETRPAEPLRRTA